MEKVGVLLQMLVVSVAAFWVLLLVASLIPYVALIFGG